MKTLVIGDWKDGSKKVRMSSHALKAGNPSNSSLLKPSMSLTSTFESGRVKVDIFNACDGDGHKK
jgi:hypothetical protein